MATKSITKEIDIKSRRFAKSFVSALENSSKKGSKKVSYTKQCKEVRGAALEEMFKNMK